jgi:hypothetical protein
MVTFSKEQKPVSTPYRAARNGFVTTACVRQPWAPSTPARVGTSPRSGVFATSERVERLAPAPCSAAGRPLSSEAIDGSVHGEVVTCCANSMPAAASRW